MLTVEQSSYSKLTFPSELLPRIKFHDDGPDCHAVAPGKSQKHMMNFPADLSPFIDLIKGFQPGCL